MVGGTDCRHYDQVTKTLTGSCPSAPANKSFYSSTGTVSTYPFKTCKT